jgi:hypothetical protein
MCIAGGQPGLEHRECNAQGPLTFVHERLPQDFFLGLLARHRFDVTMHRWRTQKKQVLPRTRKIESAFYL